MKRLKQLEAEEQRKPSNSVSFSSSTKNTTNSCKSNNTNCKISEGYNELITELKRKILKTAKIYETQKKDKNYKPYNATKLKK